MKFISGKDINIEYIPDLIKDLQVKIDDAEWNDEIYDEINLDKNKLKRYKEQVNNNEFYEPRF